jgi:hypothetical protein
MKPDIYQSDRSINYSSLISYTVSVLVFLAIWIPESGHYYVPNSVITDEMVETGRRLPDDSVLNELNNFRFGLGSLWESDEKLVHTAEKILQGKVKISGLPYIQISIPFDADDIDLGSPRWQLSLASFTIPQILLDAYTVTRHERFLTTARDIIVAWALYERRAWLPRGFLWNDHAVSARISVLARFWNLYRRNPNYQTETAKDIFQLVSRSGRLLAKPAHFTFATNHGVMQNLALWHLCLAFPTLPGVSDYKQLALERLRDQMTFYINEEGVVLEHSAGYHQFGLELISRAFRYMTLMDITIPSKWQEQYKRARDFYSNLKRPDGSLPVFGDTLSNGNHVDPLITSVDRDGRSERLNRRQKNQIPVRENSIYPVAGYSIWWNRLDLWPDMEALSQTVVLWSHFPGHGHKHADEMSVLLWASGEQWWTNVGYWPYGIEGRSEAASWNGSGCSSDKVVFVWLVK